MRLLQQLNGFKTNYESKVIRLKYCSFINWCLLNTNKNGNCICNQNVLQDWYLQPKIL
jgi:hypothetical protein